MLFQVTEIEFDFDDDYEEAWKDEPIPQQEIIDETIGQIWEADDEDDLGKLKLAHNGEGRSEQRIEGLIDHPFRGVLHGNNAEVRLPRLDRAEHLRNGGRRTEICEGAKVPLRGLLREGPLRAQVSHPLGRL